MRIRLKKLVELKKEQEAFALLGMDEAEFPEDEEVNLTPAQARKLGFIEELDMAEDD